MLQTAPVHSELRSTKLNTTERTNNLAAELLTERDVAKLTALSLATIRRRRLLGQQPKFLKIGASVRYQISTVMAWLESLGELRTR